MAQISDPVSLYKRPPPRKTLSFPWNSDDSTIPQQVHVSMVGSDRMRISWITEKAAPSRVEYGTSSGVYDSSAEGSASTYKYITYKSGLIHEAVIGPLKPDTHYYYRCSDDVSREFNLKTTPAHLPIKFVIIGGYVTMAGLCGRGDGVAPVVSMCGGEMGGDACEAGTLVVVFLGSVGCW
ncbi:hypothetical protein KSS87_005988 [Heliosperma pusillum]|nr:hypothetical protein KSS87_005988 [Heliosperma pusillum]